jgi:DNA-binding NarL/FixJ family response regulator
LAREAATHQLACMNGDDISVLHIEDDPAWSATVAHAMAARPGLRYLGSCASAVQGQSWCETLRPTLVLANARARRDSGFAALAQLKSGARAPAVALLTDRLDDLMLFHARRAWIAGALRKASFTPEELWRLCDEVARGHRYFAPDVRAAMAALAASPHAFFKILSNIELELLPRFARGETDAEIARASGASPRTIKSHRNHIMMKLDVHQSEKLMHWCIEKGFMELP